MKKLNQEIALTSEYVVIIQYVVQLYLDESLTYDPQINISLKTAH